MTRTPLRRDEVRGRVRVVLTGDLDVATVPGRAALADALGLPADHVLLPRQVHGADVVRAVGPWDGPPPGADGVLVARQGLAVGVRAADCMPLLLVAPQEGMGAAVHVGRAGLVAGIAAVALRALVDAGARAVLAVPGHTICGRCYEVPDDMREAVAAAAPGSSSTTSWGTPAVDIPAALRVQLAEQARAGGVPLEVDGSWELCTAETPSLYSHRRDGAPGRHAALVQVLW